MASTTTTTTLLLQGRQASQPASQPAIEQGRGHPPSPGQARPLLQGNQASHQIQLGRGGPSPSSRATKPAIKSNLAVVAIALLQGRQELFSRATKPEGWLGRGDRDRHPPPGQAKPPSPGQASRPSDLATTTTLLLQGRQDGHARKRLSSRAGKDLSFSRAGRPKPASQPASHPTWPPLFSRAGKPAAPENGRPPGQASRFWPHRLLEMSHSAPVERFGRHPADRPSPGLAALEEPRVPPPPESGLPLPRAKKNT